jgi:hypothetical protein
MIRQPVPLIIPEVMIQADRTDPIRVHHRDRIAFVIVTYDVIGMNTIDSYYPVICDPAWSAIRFGMIVNIIVNFSARRQYTKDQPCGNK